MIKGSVAEKSCRPSYVLLGSHRSFFTPGQWMGMTQRSICGPNADPSNGCVRPRRGFNSRMEDSSRVAKSQTRCRKCGTRFDPAASRRVVKGKGFVVTCPTCGHTWIRHRFLEVGR